MKLSRPFRWLLGSLAFVLLVFVVVLIWLWWLLNSSLAVLHGELDLPGLSAPVTIERDIQGIPTLTGQNRTDLAYALGVLHAQERFFQMDLLRRNSAGELSELFGDLAANYDSHIRLHQFRQRAQRAVDAMEPEYQHLLSAYSQGVNAGLAELGQPSFEYLLLRTAPVIWQPADTMLVLYSMYLDLQTPWNEQEQSMAVMRDLLPADWFDFLTPAGGQWDAPVRGHAFSSQAPLPRLPLAQLQQGIQTSAADWQYRDSIQLGSNNWSVSGAHSPYDAAMLANDMHLGLSVPNIWYRASWYLPTDQRRLTGVTLPGAPLMIVGSNEHLAWGFTNAYADFEDSILLTVTEDGSQYLTPDGWEDFQLDTEIVHVKGQASRQQIVQLTRWGPVIGQDHNGRLLALRWVAHDVEGANLRLLQMETANSVAQALNIAAEVGIPGQNLNVVDSAGNQAWTLIGRLPRRFGHTVASTSGQFPSDWSSGDHGWSGYLSAGEYPRIVNPGNGRIWTANARITDGADLEKLGWGKYALGARQQQIRDDLFAQDVFTEQDFLNIQLDDRAVFLQRWQALLLSSIDQSGRDDFTELRNAVDQWQGRASKTSVGYRAVKQFREAVIDHTVGAAYRNLASASDSFDPEWVSRMLEYPVWTLISQQPQQHLPQDYDSWDDFISAMVEYTLANLTDTGPLAERTWGEANTLAIRHPLSSAVPLLPLWLDMPAEPMNGDTFMPRVQGPDTGASERLVVAPGHEANGIFHMATGQSGHPLSPYYDRGHRDWVEGNASAFLPGETKWTLVLKPELTAQ